MKPRRMAHGTGGFSLVEVLIALVVISVGLLGVAKIQALALSGSGTTRMRSLASFAAASLAATMHADRTYWAHVTADPAVRVDIASATITASHSSLVTRPAGGCSAAAPCVIAGQLAAQDLHDWASSLRSTLATNTTPAATVSCQIPSGNPVICAIQISWTENRIATPYATNTLSAARQTAAAPQQLAPVSFTLYVEP